MELHANAKLGPAGRSELVRRIEEGDTLRGRGRGPSTRRPRPPIAGWGRWQEAAEQERRSGAWRADRSSRPRTSPQRAAEERRELSRHARPRAETGFSLEAVGRRLRDCLVANERLSRP